MRSPWRLASTHEAVRGERPEVHRRRLAAEHLGERAPGDAAAPTCPRQLLSQLGAFPRVLAEAAVHGYTVSFTVAAGIFAFGRLGPGGRGQRFWTPIPPLSWIGFTAETPRPHARA